MKIKIWTKYNVPYLPTKRCRKFRYKEEEEYIYADIKEVSKTELKPAFDVGYVIYSYDNKLWKESAERDIHCGEPQKPMTALEALIECGVKCSWYFGKYNGSCLDESCREQREDVIKRLESDMSDYLVVDGVLYKTTSEPMYCIYTFGLGHNHGGIGTSLSIDMHYNSNISNERYFNALEYEIALEKALEIATNRGDTKSIDYIKSIDKIVVFDEALVKRNPQLDHGRGNSFLNSLESVIEASNSSFEAGLLTMAITASEISEERKY